MSVLVNAQAEEIVTDDLTQEAHPDLAAAAEETEIEIAAIRGEDQAQAQEEAAQEVLHQVKRDIERGWIG